MGDFCNHFTDLCEACQQNLMVLEAAKARAEVREAEARGLDAAAVVCDRFLSGSVLDRDEDAVEVLTTVAASIRSAASKLREVPNEKA